MSLELQPHRKCSKNLLRDLSEAIRSLKFLLFVAGFPTRRTVFQVQIRSSERNTRLDAHVVFPEHKPSKCSSTLFDLEIQEEVDTRETLSTVLTDCLVGVLG